MPVALIFFFILLFILLILTRSLVQQVFTFFLWITRSHRLAIHLLTAMLLPGTAIHELAHLCTAFLLHVPAGHLTLIPKIEKSGEVRAGSVTVAKTDPFRLTIIGLAPIPVGIALLAAVMKIFFPSTSLLPTTNHQWLMAILGVYLLFALSCSMFSSKQDLKVLLISGPILFVLAIGMYYVGIRISLDGEVATIALRTVEQINHVLLITLGVDGIIWGILFLCSRVGHIIRRTGTHHRH